MDNVLPILSQGELSVSDESTYLEFVIGCNLDTLVFIFTAATTGSVLKPIQCVVLTEILKVSLLLYWHMKQQEFFGSQVLGSLSVVVWEDIKCIGGNSMSLY